MARNQTHRRLGAGLDASLSPGVNLYVRHQWYAYKDPNFVLNHLFSYETMVELENRPLLKHFVFSVVKVIG